MDSKLNLLSKDSRKMAFEQDCLRLTRDVAQLGCLYEEESRNARSNRLKKVLHLRHQNRVGGTEVSNFMNLNLRFIGGRLAELETAAEKASSLSKA